MSEPKVGEFRIVSNGKSFCIQRYVRVWWTLWLACRWQFVGIDTCIHTRARSYCYDGSLSYETLQFDTEQESVDRIDQIKRMEADYGPWTPTHSNTKGT